MLYSLLPRRSMRLFPARFLTEGLRNEHVEEKVLQAKNLKYTWTNAGGFSLTPTGKSGNMLWSFKLNGYVHRNSMLIKIQPDATVCRYLFTAKSLYMFRVSQHPSSGVLKTGHNIRATTSLQRGLIRPRWREIAVPVLWPVPEVAVAGLVLLMMGAVTPETCSDFAVNRYLHTVASCWNFINMLWSLRLTLVLDEGSL